MTRKINQFAIRTKLYTKATRQAYKEIQVMRAARHQLL